MSSVVDMRLRMDCLELESTESESSSEGLGELTPIDTGAPGVGHLRYDSRGQTVLEVVGENRNTAVDIRAAAVLEHVPEEVLPDILAAEPSQVSFEPKPYAPSAFSVIETDAAPLPREGIMETGGRLDPAAAKPSAALMSLVSRVRAVKKPEGDLISSAASHSQRDPRTGVGLKDEDRPMGVDMKGKAETMMFYEHATHSEAKDSLHSKHVAVVPSVADTRRRAVAGGVLIMDGTAIGPGVETVPVIGAVTGIVDDDASAHRMEVRRGGVGGALIMDGTAIGVGAETVPGIGAVTDIADDYPKPRQRHMEAPEPGADGVGGAVIMDGTVLGVGAETVPGIGAVADGGYNKEEEDATHFEEATDGRFERRPIALPPSAVCWRILTFKGWFHIEPESEQQSLEADFQRWVAGGRSDPEMEYIMFKGKGDEDMRVKLSTMSTLRGVKVETSKPIPKDGVVFYSEKYVVYEGCYVESCNIGRFPQ